MSRLPWLKKMPQQPKPQIDRYARCHDAMTLWIAASLLNIGAVETLKRFAFNMAHIRQP